MNITIAQLEAITESPEAKRLPAQTAMASNLETWWDHVDEVLRLATENDMMIVALYAKAMLETYPDLIEDINLSWSKQHDGGDTYVDSYMTVNGSYYHPDSHELGDDLYEGMETIDDFGALNALHAALEGAMGSRQTASELMDRASNLFKEDITCIEDVEKIIAQIEPGIIAFYQQKIMQLQTPAASGPKGMGRI